VRRTIVIALATVAAVLGTAAPASAGAAAGIDPANGTATAARHPWVPWPSSPFDLAAGVYCAFGVHGDPVVDEVRVKTIEEYPDGSPKRQLATGALKIQLTNTATGASTIADASGSAVFVFFPDGSSTWHVVGPVLAAAKDGNSNLPRGLWTIHGIYDINFSTTNYKTVTIYHGWLHDVCADLD
jgi:hypothetical protein